MYAELEQRVCNGCGERKEIKEFLRKSKITKSGKSVYSRCIACRKTYEQIRGWKRFYKITPTQYHELLIQQDYKCACCGQENSFKRYFHVDHDHVTGQVRGLLCTQCNPGLGYFEDSIEKLEMAIKYLRKFKK